MDVPVDIFCIEYLSGAGNVLNGEDWGRSKVGSHREVCNRANKEGDGEEIMEDLLPLGSNECKANDEEEGTTVDSCHSPEPIRPGSSEMMEITSGWIDLERIVRSLEEAHFEFWVVFG